MSKRNSPNQGLIEIKGMKQLAKAIERLPMELQKAAERGALRDAGKPIRDAARAFSRRSRDSGLLQESINLTVRKNRTGKLRGHLTARVGAVTGKARNVTRRRKVEQSDGSFRLYYRTEYANAAKYSHLVEYGTAHSKAQPFLRPAIRATRGQIESNLRKGYARGLKYAVKKVRRS